MDTYRVYANDFHGGRMLYQGKSLKQAIRKARHYDCLVCLCGGPKIVRLSDGANLLNWHAARPFYPANKPYWQGRDGEVIS